MDVKIFCGVGMPCGVGHNKRIALRSGSVVTNAGKPRRAVALKLKISPKYYIVKKWINFQVFY